MDKRSTALFFISALRYENAKRKDIVQTLVEELSITPANASYYIDRVAKA